MTRIAAAGFAALTLASCAQPGQTGRIDAAGGNPTVSSQRADQADADHASRARQQAFATASPGVAVKWQNPADGTFGTITPQPVYATNGTYCREFQETIVVAGQPQTTFGTACQQPDGTWQIIAR